MGGSNGGSNNITMDYIEIATQGDAVDFGDMTVVREIGSACSNGHGGLG